MVQRLFLVFGLLASGFELLDRGFCTGRVKIRHGPQIGHLKCSNISGNKLRLAFETSGNLKPIPDGYRTLFATPLLPSMYAHTSKLVVSTRESYLQDPAQIEDLAGMANWVWRFPQVFPVADSNPEACPAPALDDANFRTAEPVCSGGHLRDYCLSYRQGRKELVEVKYQVTIHWPSELAQITENPLLRLSLPTLGAVTKVLNVKGSATDRVFGRDRETTHTFFATAALPAQISLLNLATHTHKGTFISLQSDLIKPNSGFLNNLYVAGMVSCAM